MTRLELMVVVQQVMVEHSMWLMKGRRIAYAPFDLVLSVARSVVLLSTSMGLLGVARSNTAVGVSPETFLLLLHALTMLCHSVCCRRSWAVDATLCGFGDSACSQRRGSGASPQEQRGFPRHAAGKGGWGLSGWGARHCTHARVTVQVVSMLRLHKAVFFIAAVMICACAGFSAFRC
jgi:hypothetical protein